MPLRVCSVGALRLGICSTKARSLLNFYSGCGRRLEQSMPRGDDLPRQVCSNCGEVHYQNPKVVTAVCLSGGTLCCYANAPLTREKDSGLSPPVSWEWAKLLNGERLEASPDDQRRVEASTTSGDRECGEIALSMAAGEDQTRRMDTIDQISGNRLIHSI